MPLETGSKGGEEGMGPENDRQKVIKEKKKKRMSQKKKNPKEKKKKSNEGEKTKKYECKNEWKGGEREQEERKRRGGKGR